MCGLWQVCCLGRPHCRVRYAKSGQIRGLVGRIEVAGARILNAEARILLADAPFLHAEARILLADASFEVAEARILLAGPRILLAEAPILKQVRRFLNHPAYFMNQGACEVVYQLVVTLL